MTASRALNDLYDANLLIYEIGGKTGRSKEYRRISDPEYFEKGRRFIKSPVKKVVYVKSAPAGTLVAGLEALAELSMINPPNCSGSCWAWLAPFPTTTIRGQSESAGINRHRVGDERAPRERSSCTITTPSHARVAARPHVKR